MVHASVDSLLECLAETLETTAFVSLSPLEPEMPAPDTAILVSISLGVLGQIRIAAPRQLGVMIAANMLGLDPESPEMFQRAEDVLKEILNVTAGLYASRMCETPEAMPEMGLPQAAALDGAAAWDALIVQAGAMVVVADGFLLAAAVEGQS